jgi:beta-lactamase superfamily II metal-dependent hydrolase
MTTPDWPRFRLHVLRAGVGDALVLEYGTDAQPRFVLVDGGYADSVGTAKELLADRDIDLAVVTHIDSDHIAGAIKILETRKGRPPADVWFNGARHLPRDRVGPASVPQGDSLSGLLGDPVFRWNAAFADGPAQIDPSWPEPPLALETGLAYRLVSPGREQLRLLGEAWPDVLAAQNAPHADTVIAGAQPDPGRPIDIEALAAATPVHLDPEAANGSSIATWFQWADRSCLLAGDAHAPVLIDALDAWLGPGGVLEVDLFKLPHHGSWNNVTSELIRRVRARAYVFSTSGGGGYGHPNDEAVAKVIRGTQSNAVLAFNYANARTCRWDDAALKGHWRYRTQYPADPTQGIVLDLINLDGPLA